MSGAYIAPSSLGGGPYQGWSPNQTVLNYKSNQNVIERKLVTRAWNTKAATGVINGHNRVITPFRAVNNLGDFLARPDYTCGGPNPVTPKRAGLGGKGVLTGIISQCDGSGVAPNYGNNKFVPDSSDYIKYRRLRAANRTYNDKSFGGNDHHAEYVNRMAVHRGLS
jgi:hypothetical protein